MQSISQLNAANVLFAGVRRAKAGEEPGPNELAILNRLYTAGDNAPPEERIYIVSDTLGQPDYTRLKKARTELDTSLRAQRINGIPDNLEEWGSYRAVEEIRNELFARAESSLEKKVTHWFQSLLNKLF